MAILSQAEADAVRSALRSAFPDASIQAPGVELADAVAIAAHLTSTPFAGVDLNQHAVALESTAATLNLTTHATATGQREVRAPAAAAGGHRYYRVAATHDREKPDFTPFTGHLGMARVTLPATGAAWSQHTAIGEVLPGDHLMANLDEVRAKYAGIMGSIARVDLITPPRFLGVRFAAVSVYLGYRAGDAVPSFYVLEAGTATGDAKVLYESTSLGATLLEFTSYEPTPFSRPTHLYTAHLDLAGDSPSLLRITAHKDQSSTPYIRLSVDFNETSNPVPIWPAMHILQAALIVLHRKLNGVTKP